MTLLDGKVALVTGAARGQGRNHAVRLAQEGASVILVDICRQIETVPYPMATEGDLDETVRLVKACGGRAAAFVVDVREHDELKRAVDEGVTEFGGLDIVVANAGIMAPVIPGVSRVQAFQDVVDVNLRGVWSTVAVSRSHLLRRGPGGSIILISSVAGVRPVGAGGGYGEAKHGVIGCMRATAEELAPYLIRCNAVLPTNTATPMLLNVATYRLFRSDLEDPTLDDARDGMTSMNAMPVPYVEPDDVSEAVLWLASPGSRYVTGALIPVDAGALLK
jgi:(+)-trans-carveol dehydrogenase